MFFIERGDDGIITGLHSNPQPNTTEQKTSIDQDILEFLEKNASRESWQTLFAVSDLGAIRLLEDLVDLLIKKNIIILTELPEKAQAKILERKRIREKYSTTQNDLVVDDII